MVRPDAAPRPGLRAAPPSRPACGRRPRTRTRRPAPARPSASSWGGVGARGSTRLAAHRAPGAREDALAGPGHTSHVGRPPRRGRALGSLARRPACRRGFTMARSEPASLGSKGFRGRGAAKPGMVTGNEPRDQAPSRPLSFVGSVAATGQKGTSSVAHPLFLLYPLWLIVFRLDACFL